MLPSVPDTSNSCTLQLDTCIFRLWCSPLVWPLFPKCLPRQFSGPGIAVIDLLLGVESHSLNGQCSKDHAHFAGVWLGVEPQEEVRSDPNQASGISGAYFQLGFQLFLPPDKLCTFWTAVWWSYLHYGIQVLGHTVSTFDVVRYVQFHMRFLQK